jgi:N-lysine methyltransferase SETD6
LSRLDGDDLDESFIIERESGEPDSTGMLPGPARLQEIPYELQEQAKKVLNELRRLDATLMPDKRKRDELLVLILSTALKARLARYCTSAVEDVNLLASSEITGRRRMAIEVRLGEKKLIQEALDRLGESGGRDESNGQDRVAKRSKV